MDALDFLKKARKGKPQPVYVVTGDEDFLKRQVLAALQPLILEEADPSFALSLYPGDKADFSAVRNELDTLPFLSPRRMVVIEQADPFVTKNRAALEKYVQSPAAGVLVLDVKSWPANTKLAKLVPDASTIVCKAPAAYRMPAWCAEWAKTQVGKPLSQPAAELLVELVGPQMGVLDQEIRKLATFVGDRERIDAPDVDQLVGRSREANVFRILDAVGEGRPGDALRILDEVFEEGQEPLAVLGALGAQVRRLANAARLIRRGVPAEAALDQAGVAKWPQAREAARRQMRHLGPERLDQLFDWLLEVDLGLKGGSPLPPRLLLERLVVRMARPKAG
ncbi:MAG TPA: DNA polymerase III subunit delta [Gemmataceae bacterium]